MTVRSHLTVHLKKCASAHLGLAQCYGKAADRHTENEDTDNAEMCKALSDHHAALGESAVECCKGLAGEMQMTAKADMDGDDRIATPIVSTVYASDHIRAVPRTGSPDATALGKNVSPELRKIFGDMGDDGLGIDD